MLTREFFNTYGIGVNALVIGGIDSFKTKFEKVFNNNSLHYVKAVEKNENLYEIELSVGEANAKVIYNLKDSTIDGCKVVESFEIA